MQGSIRSQRELLWTALVLSSFAVLPHVTVARGAIRRLPSTQIAVDEDILATFVDEPCHHFEAAKDAFIRGESRLAARNLRTASAFLRLEAARATADGKINLDASVRELQRLAASIEKGQSHTVEVLQQAFARAHYALAGHHCIKSAHRCCQPAAFENKQEMSRAGQDLKAAVIHLKRGLLWAGSEPDIETPSALDTAEFAAKQLIQAGESRKSEVARAINSVRDQLEALTGQRILLAPTLAEDDKLSPSIFR